MLEVLFNAMKYYHIDMEDQHPEELQRERVQQRRTKVLELTSQSAYDTTVRAYLRHCLDAKVSPTPVNEYKAADFLHAKSSESAGGTVSWPTRQTHILMYATRMLRQDPFNEAQLAVLRDAQAAAIKEFGCTSVAPPEAGADKLRRIADAGKPGPEGCLLKYQSWVAILTAHALCLRPNMFSTKQCMTRVKHITFIPAGTVTPEGEYPQGGVTWTIPAGEHKSGRRSGNREDVNVTVQANGGKLCAVTALKEFMAFSGLINNPHAADEAVFARLQRTKGGAYMRVWRGGPILAYQMNAGIAAIGASTLLASERFTSRGMRTGRRNDLRLQGVPAEVAISAGLWGSEKAAASYLRSRPRGPLSPKLMPSYQ